MMYAAVNISWDKYVIGDSLAQLVSQVCIWRFEERTLYATFQHYKEYKYISYSEEYSEKEMRQGAVKFLANQLADHGWILFEQCKLAFDE